MRTGFVSGLALAATLTISPPLGAQFAERPVPLGTRVRVVDAAGNPPFTGSLLRLSRDTIALAAGDGQVLVYLPTSTLSSVSVSEGRDRLTWGLRGAAAGALTVGLSLAVVLGRENPGTLAGIAGLIAGGAVGGMGGALVGVIAAPERWRALSMSRPDR